MSLSKYEIEIHFGLEMSVSSVLINNTELTCWIRRSSDCPDIETHEAFSLLNSDLGVASLSPDLKTCLCDDDININSLLASASLLYIYNIFGILSAWIVFAFLYLIFYEVCIQLFFFNLVGFSEVRLHEATLNLHMHVWIFSPPVNSFSWW